MYLFCRHLRRQQADLRRAITRVLSSPYSKCYQLTLIQTFQFPYTAVRIPDVIGPFDNTKRHWRYQLWLRCSHVSLNTMPLADRLGATRGVIFLCPLAAALFCFLERCIRCCHRNHKNWCSFVWASNQLCL